MFSVVVMPALAMLTVCCSITCQGPRMSQQGCHPTPLSTHRASCSDFGTFTSFMWRFISRLVLVGKSDSQLREGQLHDW